MIFQGLNDIVMLTIGGPIVFVNGYHVNENVIRNPK